MRVVLQLAYGVGIIIVLVAVQVAAFYAIGWVTLMAVRFIPMIGKRHKHKDWERLNR